MSELKWMSYKASSSKLHSKKMSFHRKKKLSFQHFSWCYPGLLFILIISFPWTLPTTPGFFETISTISQTIFSPESLLSHFYPQKPRYEQFQQTNPSIFRGLSNSPWCPLCNDSYKISRPHWIFPAPNCLPWFLASHSAQMLSKVLSWYHQWPPSWIMFSINDLYALNLVDIVGQLTCHLPPNTYAKLYIYSSVHFVPTDATYWFSSFH